jgi:hypothetical protein
VKSWYGTGLQGFLEMSRCFGRESNTAMASAFSHAVAALGIGAMQGYAHHRMMSTAWPRLSRWRPVQLELEENIAMASAPAESREVIVAN